MCTEVDDEPVYQSTYILYEPEEANKKGWKLDIISNATGLTVIKINNVRKPKPTAQYERLLKADCEMQTALAEFLVACNKPE